LLRELSVEMLCEIATSTTTTTVRVNRAPRILNVTAQLAKIWKLNPATALEEDEREQNEHKVI